MRAPDLTLILCLASAGCSGESKTQPGDAGGDVGVTDASDAFDGGTDGPGDVAPDASVDTGDGTTEPTKLVDDPGNDEDPTLIRAADGTYHVVWFSDRSGQPDLWIKSSKDGLVWSPDRYITNDKERDFHPTLVQAKDGRFHLVWFRAGTTGASIWTMSSTDLVAWSSPFALTDESAIAWTPTLAERVPGELVVVWSSNALGDRDIWSRTSTNGGKDWGAPVRIIADPAFHDDLPYVAAKGDGTLAMSWQRYDLSLKDPVSGYLDASNDILYVTSADGTKWSAPKAITADGATKIVDLTAATFASDDASGYSVAWTTTRAPATSAGGILSLGLSAGLATATNVRLLDGATSGYTPRFARVSGNLYLMVWVGIGKGSAHDLYRRFVRT